MPNHYVGDFTAHHGMSGLSRVRRLAGLPNRLSGLVFLPPFCPSRFLSSDNSLAGCR